MKSYGQMIFESYARELCWDWPWEAIEMPVQAARRKHGPCLEARLDQAAWNRIGQDVATQLRDRAIAKLQKAREVLEGGSGGAYDTDDLAVDREGETYNLSGDGEPEGG